ncbi:hypothetical protein CAEBREN_00371 [Caenorhabditis brenneri]|uniref:Palmitoyltransferase n=1 Tax=Caenorhabditis brenneri TaxID=135651 RepID=G0NHD4_CAEBE|nr:hypothetical protein CAEBREN_00371 [Caenorhabditis brenneri]
MSPAVPILYTIIYIQVIFMTVYEPATDELKSKVKGDKFVRKPYTAEAGKHVIVNSFCTICEVRTFRETKHCKRCNFCIDDFDHHCVWLNNCIGGKNYSRLAEDRLGILFVNMYRGLWNVGAISQVSPTHSHTHRRDPNHIEEEEEQDEVLQLEDVDPSVPTPSSVSPSPREPPPPEHRPIPPVPTVSVRIEPPTPNGSSNASYRNHGYDSLEERGRF